MVPAVAEVTAAVNVTLVPTVDGFNDDVTVVVVVDLLPAFTTCETTGDVDVE
jgi:hypothetical protein